MNGLFITGTGTGVGKTWLTRGLAAALHRRGVSVAAIKPLETGCDPDPADALELARACGREELARAPGLYRARPPLAPYAATLEGEPPVDLDAVLAATRDLAADVTLVEGAGGLLVPLDAEHTLAELAAALALPLVIVARDGLGVLSATLTTAECAARRGLVLRAVVLSPPNDPHDASPATNARILQERLDCPVLRYAPARDDDAVLADAAERLLAVLLDRP